MRRHVCTDPEFHIGQVIGNGQCAVLVEMITPGLGLTKGWRAGPRVLAVKDLARGTVIATFDPDGRYGNHTDGRSHAAIFMGFTEHGDIEVIDQWHGQPTHRRVIHKGHYPAVNDAEAYSVVETEE